MSEIIVLIAIIPAAWCPGRPMRGAGLMEGNEFKAVAEGRLDWVKPT